jgi:hypothetical protein
MLLHLQAHPVWPGVVHRHARLAHRAAVQPRNLQIVHRQALSADHQARHRHGLPVRVDEHVPDPQALGVHPPARHRRRSVLVWIINVTSGNA